MRPELSSGTVTFLFTDIEGSARLREAWVAEGGIEVQYACASACTTGKPDARKGSM